MDVQELLEMVAKALEVDAGGLTPTESLAQRNWDSLANVILIAEIDDRFGITVDPDALANADTVEEIHALVQAAAA